MVVRAAGIDWHATGDASLREQCLLLLRPEGVRLASAGSIGTVARRRFAGAIAFYAVTLPDGIEVEVAGPPDAARVGESVHLEPTGIGAHAFPADR